MSKFSRLERFLFYLYLVSAIAVLRVIGFREPILPNMAGSAVVMVLVVAALWVESKGWIALKRQK